MRPTALEVAAGRMYGEDCESAAVADLDDRDLSPLAALEKAVLPALRRPPCLVSFSGGRDSSGVLAAATLAARREGLPLPVPITLRLTGAPAAEESAWQERVIRHLGLCEWEIREAGEDLDRLGPYSANVLRRYGVLYSPNAFLQIPLLEGARSRPLLTGLGGDEILAGWRWSCQADLLGRRRRLAPRDPIRFAYAASPALVRRWREEWASRADRLPWLRREPARKVAELTAAARAEQPRSWSGWVDWRVRRRSLRASQWTLSLLAADAGVQLLHPLLDPAFLSALARSGARWGFGDRTAAMRAIFAEVLPEAVISRQTKAHYKEVLWGRHSREFVAHWDGRGVDGELVDVEELRREWLKPDPHGGTAMLLQTAWLSQQGSGGWAHPLGG